MLYGVGVDDVEVSFDAGSEHDVRKEPIRVFVTQVGVHAAFRVFEVVDDDERRAFSGDEGAPRGLLSSEHTDSDAVCGLAFILFPYATSEVTEVSDYFGIFGETFEVFENALRHGLIAADDEDEFFVRDAFSDLKGFETDSPERVPDCAAGGLGGAAGSLDVNFDAGFVVRDEVEELNMVRLQGVHGLRVVEVVFDKEPRIEVSQVYD